MMAAFAIAILIEAASLGCGSSSAAAETTLHAAANSNLTTLDPTGPAGTATSIDRRRPAILARDESSA